MENIKKCKKDELKICSDLLFNSFKDYNFFQVYVEDESKRENFLKALFDFWIKAAFKKQTVLIYKNNNEILGVMILKCPWDKDISLLDFIFYGGIKMIFSSSLKDTIGFIDLLEKSDKPCQSLNESKPKFFLSLLAISLNYKRQGIGTKMLLECENFVKSKGKGTIALNTNTEENKNFYLKNGYEEFFEEILSGNNKKIPSWSYKKEIL